MNKNLKTILLTITCIAAIQLLIYFNYKNNNNYYYSNKENITPIQQNNQIQNNQFPFSIIEYDIKIGSKQIPNELTLDKTNLFNVKCYIKKEDTNFAINYKIQYLGLKKCGLRLTPITDKNIENNSYDFVEFEPFQIIEFNKIISSIEQLKIIKPIITFLHENNDENNTKTVSFILLDDILIPY